MLYYESQKPGLGRELSSKVHQLSARLANLPASAPMWSHRPDHRIAKLARFPYRLPYRVQRDRLVILALAHTSRRPDYWMDRLATLR